MEQSISPPFINIKDKHSKILNLLAKMAITVTPVANARFASAIVYKNDVVSFGTNAHKSHPFQARFGKNQDSIYLHSEINAIYNALKQTTTEILSKSTLYICRVKYESEFKENFIFGLSKPCLGCSRAISEFKIKNVIYSLDGNKYGCL
jgi:tRNA(Arg) A34 adenosine deaminase TadA